MCADLGDVGLEPPIRALPPNSPARPLSSARSARERREQAAQRRQAAERHLHGVCGGLRLGGRRALLPLLVRGHAERALQDRKLLVRVVRGVLEFRHLRIDLVLRLLLLHLTGGHLLGEIARLAELRLLAERAHPARRLQVEVLLVLLRRLVGEGGLVLARDVELRTLLEPGRNWPGSSWAAISARPAVLARLLRLGQPPCWIACA